jgi:hypothetical protein
VPDHLLDPFAAPILSLPQDHQHERTFPTKADPPITSALFYASRFPEFLQSSWIIVTDDQIFRNTLRLLKF